MQDEKANIETVRSKFIRYKKNLNELKNIVRNSKVI